MKTKLKSLENIWKAQKQILKAADEKLPVKWGNVLPDDKELYGLLVRRSEVWTNPKDTVELTSSKLKDTVDSIVPQLENVWGYKMLEPPVLEIVKPKDYLSRINHYENLVSNVLGYGAPLQSPPSAYHAASYKVLLLPSMFVIREPKGKMTQGHFRNSYGHLFSSDFEILPVPWEKSHLEEVIAAELSFALFRQARGEWGEDYIKVMNAVGINAKQEISMICQASGLIANERLCAQNPKWGLHVVSDAIQEIWANRFRLAAYVAVDAASQSLSLHKASMMDGFEFLSENDMRVSFNQMHPSDAEKRKEFGTVLRFTQ